LNSKASELVRNGDEARSHAYARAARSILKGKDRNGRPLGLIQEQKDAERIPYVGKKIAKQIVSWMRSHQNPADATQRPVATQIQIANRAFACDSNQGVAKGSPRMQAPRGSNAPRAGGIASSEGRFGLYGADAMLPQLASRLGMHVSGNRIASPTLPALPSMSPALPLRRAAAGRASSHSSRNYNTNRALHLEAGRKRKRVAFPTLFKCIMDEALDAADIVRMGLGIPKHTSANNRRKGRVRMGSAAYSILLVLYRAMIGWGKDGFWSVPERALTRDRIVKLASQFFDGPELLDERPLDRSSSGSNRFYTGWNCMKSLISEHGYVETYKQSRQNYYRLTPIGKAVAKVLSQYHAASLRLRAAWNSGLNLPSSLQEAIAMVNQEPGSADSNLIAAPIASSSGSGALDSSRQSSSPVLKRCKQRVPHTTSLPSQSAAGSAYRPKTNGSAALAKGSDSQGEQTE